MRRALLILLVCHVAFSEDGRKNKTARSKPKLKSIPLSLATSKCKQIDCPATEDPTCAKIKFRQDANKTLFIRMLNKCEMEYSKCHTDIEATKVPLKYCDDHGTFKKIQKYLKTSVSPKQDRRLKRSVRYPAPIPQVQFREDDEYEKEEDNEVDVKVTKLNYDEVRRRSAKRDQNYKGKSVLRYETKSAHPRQRNQQKNSAKKLLRVGKNKAAESSKKGAQKDSSLPPRYTISRGHFPRQTITPRKEVQQKQEFSAPMFDGTVLSGGNEEVQRPAHNLYPEDIWPTEIAHTTQEDTKHAHQQPGSPLLDGKMFDKPMFSGAGNEEVQRPAAPGVQNIYPEDIWPKGLAHHPGSASFPGKILDNPPLGGAETPPDSNSEVQTSPENAELQMPGKEPPPQGSKGAGAKVKTPGHFDKPMFKEPMFGGNQGPHVSPDNQSDHANQDGPNNQGEHTEQHGQTYQGDHTDQGGQSDQVEHNEQAGQNHQVEHNEQGGQNHQGEHTEQDGQTNQGDQTDQGGQIDQVEHNQQGGQNHQYEHNEQAGQNHQIEHNEQAGQNNQDDHTVQGEQGNQGAQSKEEVQDVPTKAEIHDDPDNQQLTSYERHMAKWNREENFSVEQINDDRVTDQPGAQSNTTGDCPKACSTRARMVCARCNHRVYRTFMSLCHMRLFACLHKDERVELAAHFPCLMLAPYLMNDVETIGAWPQTQHDDIDAVEVFAHCRNKSKQRDSTGRLVPIDRHDPVCGIRIEPRT